MLNKLTLFRYQTLFLTSTHHLNFPKLLSSITPITLHINSYGPSLQKGTIPSNTHLKGESTHLSKPQFGEENDENPAFDEARFTRVFELAALRVPSDRCHELEGRIRGHLLNWARIPNIARVPGDEIDDGVRNLIGFGDVGVDQNGVLSSVLGNMEVGRGEFDEKMETLMEFGDGNGVGELSGVLYREKLAKEFNARGFVKFRNLAKISRPNKRKKKRKGKEGGGEDEGEKSEGWRRRSMLVEVVEGGEDGVGGDLSGLLGEEFKGRKWRGSTRLLLLDERYAGRKLEELPEAVKAVLNEGSSEATYSSFELVRCNLTLFYDYWPMNEVLEALLPKDMVAPSAFESVGHIAHLNLSEEHLPYKKLIGKVVLDKNKPKIQTVVNKIEAISNEYRTMQLEVLSGNRSLVTTVLENGIRFHVDLGTVYWNSRLGTERQRLISCFTSEDVLCDVFSGVGPIAISAAKKVKRVYANDLNPYAVDYLQRNCVLNKLERKIEVFNMDGRRFIDLVFSSDKDYSITQVVMNLPKNAEEFLDAFRGIYRDKPKDRKLTFPMIHVYGFSRAEDPDFDFHERIRVALREAAIAVEMRRVRMVSPGKWMLCASFVLPEKVAFCKDFVDCE